MTRSEVPLDAAEIFRALARHRVDVVVVGGLAVQVHGHVRTTQDVDLVPAPDGANLERLAAALRELGARPAGELGDRAFPLDATTLAAPVTSLDTDAGGVDVHREPPGAPPYAELRERALEVGYEGSLLPVAGLDDLIAMKRAAGRPVDRGDVLALTDPLC